MGRGEWVDEVYAPRKGMGRTGKGVAVDGRRVDAGSESWEE
jgi:hypothetical protein